MQYVVSAEEYFNSINENNQNLDRLVKYFENIPEAFFEALERTDWSKMDDFFNLPVDEAVSQAKLDHQLFLLEHIEDINDIIQKEDFLVRAGYDTVALRESGEYLATLQTIDESLLGTVWSFIKGMVADPDPVEMTLNIIRLVLDVIGIVPFTWAGFPIDIVANVLSAIISLYKKDWFSMILSLLSAVDVSKVNAIATKFLKPAAPIINKIAPILFRSSSSAVALEKVIINSKEELIKIGGKSLLDNVVSMFKNIASFLVGSGVSIIKLIAGFVEKAINLATFGTAKKYTAKIPQFVDKLAANINLWGKNFDSASKVLAGAEGDSIAKASDDLVTQAKTATQGEKSALIKQAQADAIAAGKKGNEIGVEIKKKLTDFDNAIVDKYLNATGYLGDLRGVVTKTDIFKNRISKLSDAEQEIWIAAKMENEIIGQAKLSADAILKDKALAKRLADLGWRPGSADLIAMARKGDEAGVKKFFETFLTDPQLSKNLSKAEIKAFTPFVARPKAFVEGVKHMDETIKVAKTMEGLGRTMAMRAIPLRRVISFLSRLVWQQFGNLECLVEVGANKMSTSVATATTKLAAKGMEAAFQPAVNEADEPVATQAQPAESTQDPAQLDALVAQELEKNKKLKETLKAKKGKADCGMLAAANSATVSAHVADYPGSTANLGGTFNVGDDPKARQKFQDNTTEYSQKILKSMNLDTSIGAQKAIDGLDPVTQLALSDVWDAEHGVVSVNSSDVSRMKEVADRFVKNGTWTQEEADRAIKQTEEMLDSGNMPEIPLPKSAQTTDESLFKTKGFGFTSINN
jgi:hypothetical protein